jgi:hypothetical protein
MGMRRSYGLNLVPFIYGPLNIAATRQFDQVTFDAASLRRVRETLRSGSLGSLCSPPAVPWPRGREGA